MLACIPGCVLYVCAGTGLAKFFEQQQLAIARGEAGGESPSTVAVLLAVAVLLVTGNTIRLAIESRREEIVVIKLVGGTDAFVRRPLLYTGFWYGLGGAAVAY